MSSFKSFGVAGVASVSGVVCSFFGAVIFINFAFLVACKKLLRISVGMFVLFKMSCSVVSVGSGSFFVVSGAGVTGSGVGASCHSSIMQFGIFIFGNLIGISFLFIVSFIVAMYTGIMASINIEKTKPAKPVRRACANMFQWYTLNILNLNKRYKIVLIKNMYHTVHDNMCE